MRFRSKQLLRRIAQRRESKEEEAARIVQYYYRNKLRVGRLGGLLASLAEEKAKQDREHQAAERAKQRREQMVREQEQIAYSEKAKALEKRRRALAEALKNLAAVEFVQKILRGYVARSQRRKLTKERKEYLRGISSLGSTINTSLDDHDHDDDVSHDDSTMLLGDSFDVPTVVSFPAAAPAALETST